VQGVPLSEILWLVAVIVAGGIVTGLLAGLFGIGGGGIIVPVLYEVFRALDVPEAVRMQLCIGTSLAIIVPTTIRSYRTHAARGAALPTVVRQWALPAICGVAIGALTAALAPAAVFKLAFVIITASLGLKTLFWNNRWHLGDKLPGRAAMSGYGLLVGLSSSLIGVSGGAISSMALMLYRVPIHQAVATSAGVGVPVTIAGMIGYVLAGWRYQPLLPPLSLGFVSIIGVVLMAPISSFSASFGARLAHRLSRRRLEIAFGVFMLSVALRFVISLI